MAEMYPTKEAMVFLNQALHLPATGREQDWEIELADPDRAGEFVAYLEAHALDPDKTLALMALILGSLEDLANSGQTPPELWDRVKCQLRANPALYADLLRQWEPKDDDPDGFAISPMIACL